MFTVLLPSSKFDQVNFEFLFQSFIISFRNEGNLKTGLMLISDLTRGISEVIDSIL